MSGTIRGSRRRDCLDRGHVEWIDHYTGLVVLASTLPAAAKGKSEPTPKETFLELAEQ